MGAEENSVDTPSLHTFDDFHRSRRVGRAVVHSGHQMAMDVGVKR